MDSKLYVPVKRAAPATAQPYLHERALSSSSSASTGSLFIRALPTLDSDSDSESNGHKIYGTSGSSVSDSEYESEKRYLSGEEFETVSEKPLVTDPDEETLEDSVKFELSRPFVADPDGETSEISFEDEGVDEYGPLVEPTLVDSPNLDRVMPIAKLSRDDDEEEEEEEEEEGIVSEVDEESDFSGAVRVPSIEVLEKVDSAPRLRVKVLSVEEEEDELVEWKDSLVVKQSGPAIEVKVVEDLVSDAFVERRNGVLGFGEENTLVVEEPDEDSVLAELVEDKGPVVVEAARVESLMANGEYLMEKSSKLDDDVKHSGEEKRVDKEGIEVLSENDAVSMNSTTRRESVVDAEETNEVVEGTSGVVGETNVEKQSAVTHAGTYQIEETMEPNLLELNADDREAEANVKYVAKEPMVCQNSESSGVDVSFLDKISENEKLESKMERGIDVGVESHDSTTSTQVECINDAIKGNQIQCMDSTKFSEPNPNQDTILLRNGDLSETTESGRLEDELCRDSSSLESEVLCSSLTHEVKPETKHEAELGPDIIDEEEVEGKEGSLSDKDVEGIILGKSGATKQLMHEFEQRPASSSLSGAESQDHSQIFDGQIVLDSDEGVDTDKDGEGKQLFDYAALAALLKEITSAESNVSTITPPDGTRVSSLEHPAGLGSSVHSLRPARRLNQTNIFSSDLRAEYEFEDNLNEEEKKRIEQLQVIRVKFLRFVQRLGLSPEDPIVEQVLYRLILATGRHSSQTFILDSAAKRLAMQLEAESKDDLDFSLNILVLGQTGVGKSATINSIVGEKKATIDAFEPATKTVKEIVGIIHGVKIRVLDTPGLRSHVMEQANNRKILASIKKMMKKFPPDIVLYVDRLDTHAGDHNDLPLLRSITTSLGSSIWQRAVITLTHAASAPPDGPTGSPIGYNDFVSRRSRFVQQSISQAVGDLGLMNPSPVSLVENHPLCRKNSYGERVLPNGLIWRPQLLLLCYSLKILSEADSLLKPQKFVDHQKLFVSRLRSPPLPYFLASLLQSHVHPKLPGDQDGNNVDSDIGLGNLLDSEEEDEDEYDQLPPFKPLRRSQIAKLSKEQRKAYFEEYDYRVKLLQKKQLREQVKRMREMKKKGKDGGNNFAFLGEEGDGDLDDESPADVPVPLPDMVLPLSFDGDNPAFRYRLLEPTSQLLVRSVPGTQGWDHDFGYDAVILERNLAIAGQFPADFTVEIMKDKSELTIFLDSSVSKKHGENGSTMAGFNIQTVGKQLAYILRGETKVKNFNINKTTAGVTVTFLDENVATGLKIEDQIAVGKRMVLVGSTGVVRSQDETAYGANLEVRLREKDFPIGQNQSTLGLSLVKWRGDLSLMANLQSQFSIGRSSKMTVHVGLNDRQRGQITVKTSSLEQLQIALIGILPIAASIFRSISPGFGMKNSM